MKKFFMMLEEVWVATSFAEAGAYDAFMIMNKSQQRLQKFARLRSERSC